MINKMETEIKTINPTAETISENVVENSNKVEGPITRETTIGDIIQKYPGVVDILMATGVHCVGCHVAAFESLEQGLKGHGKSDAEVDKLINDLNSALAAQNEQGNEEFTISDKALSEIKSNLKENQFLRIEVISGGCSGKSYGLSLDDQRRENDHKIEIDGIEFVSDEESFKMIKGSKLEYIDTFEEKGFRFVNPNAKRGCGCGKSFGV